MQSKLLRVLEDQQVQRLGGNRRIQIDMRVIAASNAPLEDLTAQGRMRSDFYYRINVIPIHLIPLRERREDIPLLIDDFLRHHPVAAQKGVTGMSRDMMNRLMQHSWPGNIRELQNALERAIVLTAGHVIEKVDLPQKVSCPQGDGNTVSSTLSLSQWLREQEKRYLIQQLQSFGGKVGLTAKSCGLAVRTLSRKMHLYGIHKKDLQRKASEIFLSGNENLLNETRHRDS
jgi:DNA-binding NtrC family response regulator